MTDSQYRIILYCSRSDRDLIDRIRVDLKAQLDLADPLLETLFSGQPVVMQQAAGREEAERIRAAVEAAGGSCEIEPIDMPRMIDPLGFVERRRTQRRRPGDRRQRHRGGPERRQGDRRRSRARPRFT